MILVVYVPLEDTDAVCLAMCEAGAGTVGDGHYDRVTFVSRCTCNYRVLDRPCEPAGATGSEHKSDENRIEAICRHDRIEAVIQAIVDAHPYEIPAIAIMPTLTGEYQYWKS